MPDFRTQAQRLAADDPDAPWNQCEPMPGTFNDQIRWYEGANTRGDLPQDWVGTDPSVLAFTGQPPEPFRKRAYRLLLRVWEDWAKPTGQLLMVGASIIVGAALALYLAAALAALTGLRQW